MSGNKSDKIIYIVFAVAALFFVVTVSVLLFSKCADDPAGTDITPHTTIKPEQTPEGTLPSESTLPDATNTQATPTITTDPYSTPSPTPVPSHIIDKTAGASVKKKYYIEVSLKAQLVYIYEMTASGGKGQLVKAMICSTGRAGNETPETIWVILENNINDRAKYRWQWLYNDVSGHYATRLFEVTNYGQSNESYVHRPYLFHSVPYETYGENDTLQWEEWNKLGTPASDGCIRLAVEDSKWIYDNVAAYSYVFTIQGVEDPMLWNALKRKDIDASYKYDPTDYDYIASL
ncbi:MAG: hypothetical protein E7385_01945 [Ruminococcaceae bacterium]|nr:hypothetical protein [Oscillospiraceae bacterium]